MSDQVTAPSPTAADPKATAANIAKGIQDKGKGQTPPADKAVAAAAPVDPNAGKERFVVEGKEVWLSPEQARAYVQKGIAFEPRMDQLARLQQEYSLMERALLNDPGKVLANLAKAKNVPLKTMVEKILAGNADDEIKETVGKWFYDEAVVPMRLTPEQLKAREDAKWRSERERQDTAAKEEAIKRENQERVSHSMGELKTFINEAMKDSGLPDNNTALGAEMARMVADEMRVARFQKRSLTPKQAIESVKKNRIFQVQKDYYENLDDEQLASQLGENVVKKIQNYLLKKAKTANGMSPNGESPAVRQPSKKQMSRDEVFDYFAELKKR